MKLKGMVIPSSAWGIRTINGGEYWGYIKIFPGLIFSFYRNDGERFKCSTKCCNKILRFAKANGITLLDYDGSKIKLYGKLGELLT